MGNYKEELKDAICNNDINFLIANKDKYNINERFEDEDNDTLLLYAISYDKSNVYQFFLDNGADYNLVNDLGENIVHAIVFSGDLNRMQRVLKGYNTIDINRPSKDGTTPLLLSISLDKLEIANYLIEKGADVNVSDENGLSPLHMAAESDDLELVQFLVAEGADLTAKTNKGNRPLALSVNNSKNNEIIKFLYNRIYNL
jgi:ankyrin repeat protein